MLNKMQGCPCRWLKNNVRDGRRTSRATDLVDAAANLTNPLRRVFNAVVGDSNNEWRGIQKLDAPVVAPELKKQKARNAAGLLEYGRNERI